MRNRKWQINEAILHIFCWAVTFSASCSVVNPWRRKLQRLSNAYCERRMAPAIADVAERRGGDIYAMRSPLRGDGRRYYE